MIHYVEFFDDVKNAKVGDKIVASKGCVKEFWEEWEDSGIQWSPVEYQVVDMPKGQGNGVDIVDSK